MPTMVSQLNDDNNDSVPLEDPLLAVPKQPSASRLFLNRWVVVWSAITFVLFYSLHIIYYREAFSRLYGDSTIATYALPLHLVASPVALFGGMFQVYLGVKKRTALHKQMGRLVATCMALGLVGAYGLIPLLPSRRGWHYTLILVVLAAYTTVNLVLGIYYMFVKKDPWQHKAFMLRTLGGWFNFVALRWAAILSGGSDWAVTAAELAMLVAVEIVLAREKRQTSDTTRYNPVIDLADIDE